MMSGRLRVDTQELVSDSNYIPFMSAHPQCPDLQMALMLLADKDGGYKKRFWDPSSGTTPCVST